MAERAPVTPVDVLAALADLSPSAERSSSGASISTEWFRWLPSRSITVLAPPVRHVNPQVASMPSTSIDRGVGERLAAVAQVRALAFPVRVGWLFVAGRQPTEDGRSRAVLHPLVSVPVRVELPFGWGDAVLHPIGDVGVSPLIEDDEHRRDIEARLEAREALFDASNPRDLDAARLAELHRLQSFARSAAQAAGFGEAREVVVSDDSPESLIRQEGLRIVAGVGIYATDDVGGTTRAGALRAWADRPVDPVTAFHALYRPEPEAPVAVPREPVDSPFALTPGQSEAVLRSRRSAVTVVSGAPGTGKSHTVVAIATDAMARGESVLVAAKTDAAVDALVRLLERAPGPTPVVFGSAERREQLARRLSAGQLLPVADTDLAEARRRSVEAIADRNLLQAEVQSLLEAEAAGPADGRRRERARVDAPGLFDPATDLDLVARTMADAVAPGRWWGRRGRRRRWADLRSRLGLAASVEPDEVTRLLATARVARAVADLAESGGLGLDAEFAELARLDDEARRAMARWLAAQSRSSERLTGDALGAVSALATSLRSGRSARRHQLSRMDATLTRALPLWLGTLADIEDLLPPHPGLFDLVIVDEASSIEQPLATPALLRGHRTVVAGDPQQLRHVSFVSDERQREVMAAHGLDRLPVLAARLDIRRNSLFDVAAGAAPVTVLDEHFRSDPHLVEFVARRLYGGALHVASRNPVTECRDCIETRRVEGDRDEEGVLGAEIQAVVAELRSRRAAGARSIGVVTPFRAQADALEVAVLEAFTVDDLRAMDLRVGTVHAFQGNERDLVLVSLGVGPASGAQPWTFVDDPHLFAVLATRGRRRMIVIHSADPPPGSLVADYLAQDDRPPGRVAAAGEPGPWTRQVADALTSAGVAVRPGYPTGRHVVDLVLDDPHRAVAVECEVHPDGAAAHVERRLALERAGWDVVDAFASRWEGRTGAMVLHLLDVLGPGDP